jgi:hypothetical protein
MNTKNKQNEKNKKTRQDHGPKKQGQNPNMYQDHEHPETRLTR